MNPVRLTVVDTHPVQYLAPWFRYIAAHCPEIELTVLYASRPTPEQQAVGFGSAFAWDLPLLEGYRCRVVRESRPGDRFDSERFRGLDVPEIADALLDTRPEAVLLAGWHSVTQVRALMASRRHGIPLLYRGDTHMGMRPRGIRGPLWRVKTRLLLHRYAAHLAVGRRSREWLLAHGVPPTRIYASPHSVDNEFFAERAAPHLTVAGRIEARRAYGFSPEDFVVLFAGRFLARKQLPAALRAVAELGPTAGLIVAGDGARADEARTEARRLGVRVTWAGFLNQPELGRAYAAADCFVLPAYGESWGLVVNEAMATGLPAVVRDGVGCAPDLIVPGETGETFRGDADHDLAAALARVRACGGRTEMAAACRARIDRYGFPQSAVGLVAACQSVAQPRRAPRVLVYCGGMVSVFGLERMTFETLGTLRAAGAAVHCVVNGWENHRIVPLAERIGASWSTGFDGWGFQRRALSARRLAQMAWDIVFTSAGLLRTAWSCQPTHVLLPDYPSAIRNALALCVLRAWGVSVVMALHNAPDPGRFYRRLWRWAVNPIVDRFVANSQYTERELLAHGIPKDKVRYIYNAAPLRVGIARPIAGGLAPGRIVYVGQMIPGKGVAELLDALGLLVARGSAATLDIVGPIDGWTSPSYGDFRGRLLERAARTDLAGRVRFLGWRENVHEVLSSAAVHCCPSQPALREAFGLVTLEAKIAGVPSVVTPVGALPELVVHGVDGWVCRDASPAAIAEGLEYFLASPSRQSAAALAALHSAARFDREGFESAWREVFQSATSPAGSLPPRMG